MTQLMIRLLIALALSGVSLCNELAKINRNRTVSYTQYAFVAFFAAIFVVDAALIVLIITGTVQESY